MQSLFNMASARGGAFRVFFADVVILKLKAAQSDFNWHPPSFWECAFSFHFRNIFNSYLLYCDCKSNIGNLLCY